MHANSVFILRGSLNWAAKKLLSRSAIFVTFVVYEVIDDKEGKTSFYDMYHQRGIANNVPPSRERIEIFTETVFEYFDNTSIKDVTGNIKLEISLLKESALEKDKGADPNKYVQGVSNMFGKYKY